MVLKMKHNYRKLQILTAIDILCDDSNECFSRTKDITKLIGGWQKNHTTSQSLSHYLNWGYIKVKRGKRYDKNVKRQRQICYRLTEMGERVLEKLENRYYAGKDLNLREGHIVADVDFSEEGETLLLGLEEMQREGLL